MRATINKTRHHQTRRVFAFIVLLCATQSADEKWRTIHYQHRAESKEWKLQRAVEDKSLPDMSASLWLTAYIDFLKCHLWFLATNSKLDLYIMKGYKASSLSLFPWLNPLINARLFLSRPVGFPLHLFDICWCWSLLLFFAIFGVCCTLMLLFAVGIYSLIFVICYCYCTCINLRF